MKPVAEGQMHIIICSGAWGLHILSPRPLPPHLLVNCRAAQLPSSFVPMLCHVGRVHRDAKGPGGHTSTNKVSDTNCHFDKHAYSACYVA